MSRPPNVLLICVDHWPANLLRAAGHSHILSPTLDQLSANGVRFSRAYSTTPMCIPARRALMTGTTTRTHGDRVFDEHGPMPAELPTMPAVFRANGYQAHAVGKLHVHPQRNRIGFEDVVLFEEGRRHVGNVVDDYELHLRDAGYAGQELTHAMGNNAYTVRPWHLPEELHPTNWTVREMSRVIQRRDPTRPAFWYCSFAAPHPPVVPPAAYLDMYEEGDLPMPVVAEWAQRFEDWPYALRARYHHNLQMTERETRRALRGFYAQCTYIDHQIRLLIGVLREDGELDNTVLMFTSDHGDMLGQHRLWSKPPLYDAAAAVPLILVPPPTTSGWVITESTIVWPVSAM